MPPADTPQSTFHAPEGFEIPPGFVIGTIGDDNQPFLVPYYMVPTLERVISVKRAQNEPEIAKATAKPELLQPTKHVVVADVEVKVPPNPPPTDHELLRLHAEAVALSKRYGTSYKDACVRLYHEEHQRIIVADRNAKAWENLQITADQALWNMKNTRDTIRDVVAEENKRAQKK